MGGGGGGGDGERGGSTTLHSPSPVINTISHGVPGRGLARGARGLDSRAPHPFQRALLPTDLVAPLGELPGGQGGVPGRHARVGLQNDRGTHGAGCRAGLPVLVHVQPLVESLQGEVTHVLRVVSVVREGGSLGSLHRLGSVAGVVVEGSARAR